MKNKSPIVLKFNNLEDKLNFESERDAYYINQIDRKSTRLNSSHVSISYAVFCLKKKNKQKKKKK